MRIRVMFFLFALALPAFPASAFAGDASGCRDHPMFSRMPGFYIDDCEIKEFDSEDFAVSEDREVKVEGKNTYISYVANEGTVPPSETQIMRNYANAIKKIGGTVQYQSSYDIILKLEKGGAETWVKVITHSGDSYSLTIVEKKAMVQDITASDMLDALNKDGFVALYINFDTGKATIKPD